MTVTIATAAIERLPARTFYVSSLAQKIPRLGNDRRRTYVVKWMWRRVTCNCPDFVHRGQVLHRPCKHTRLVRLFAREVGGLKNIPRGVKVRVHWKEDGCASVASTTGATKSGSK